MYVIRDNYGVPSPPRYFLKAKPELSQPEAPKPEPEKPAEAWNSGNTPAQGPLDWRLFVVTLMRALLPFPEAKEAVMAAFREQCAEASP
jgi:hypothetical protein